MRIRKLAPPDRDEIASLVRSSGTFNDEEAAVAMELVDLALARPEGDYLVLVCDDEAGVLAGYLCYGRTPMTEATYDLYWVATRVGLRGRGVGTRLVVAMEAEVEARGGKIVRIETSQLGEYDAARAFYARMAYHEVGRIRDFYRTGDDLITLAKRLDSASARLSVPVAVPVAIPAPAAAGSSAQAPAGAAPAPAALGVLVAASAQRA
jgi:ribosomal protein S18 acetylase RimI-like enzyme